MIDRRNLLKLAGMTSMVSVVPTFAHAGPFPSKPLDWIVPFAPGGGADRWSRVLSSVALDVVDYPMRIKNIEGASGSVGWKDMLSHPADGHTLLIASPTPVIELVKTKSAPFPPERVKIVCFISAFNAILVARPNRNWSSWAGLLAYAKSHPGKLRLGMTYSELIGTALSLRSEGIKAQLIPYASTSTAVTDMLGDRLDVTAVTPSTALSLYPDQVVTLLNATKRPLPEDINEQLGRPPHAVDLGYEAINFPRWIGVHPDTPDELVAELSAHIGSMLEQESLKLIMGRLGEDILFTPHHEAQDQYQEMVSSIRSVVSSMDS